MIPPLMEAIESYPVTDIVFKYLHLSYDDNELVLIPFIHSL